MAVSENRPKRTVRKPGNPWSQPHQARRSLPILRLLTSISSIPEVARIEMLVDGSGTYLHVVMGGEIREAEYRIYHAERDYLNATELHHFNLDVVSCRWSRRTCARGMASRDSRRSSSGERMRRPHSYPLKQELKTIPPAQKFEPWVPLKNCLARRSMKSSTTIYR